MGSVLPLSVSQITPSFELRPRCLWGLQAWIPKAGALVPPHPCLRALAAQTVRRQCPALNPSAPLCPSAPSQAPSWISHSSGLKAWQKGTRKHELEGEPLNAWRGRTMQGQTVHWGGSEARLLTHLPSLRWKRSRLSGGEAWGSGRGMDSGKRNHQEGSRESPSPGAQPS